MEGIGNAINIGATLSENIIIGAYKLRIEVMSM
jgi:hypothetical protein